MIFYLEKLYVSFFERYIVKTIVSKVILFLLIYSFTFSWVNAQDTREIDIDELVVKGFNEEQLNSVGMSSYYNGNYPLALACFKEKLKIHVENKEEEKIRKTRIFLAEILRGAGSYETGLLILKKVESKISHEKPVLIHAYLFNRKAAIYFEYGDIEKAKDNARKAISIEREIESSEYISNSVNILGACFRSKGLLDSANFYINEAYQMALKDSSQIDNLIVNGFNKANYLNIVKQRDSAIFYAKHMVKLCKRHNQSTQLFHLYDLISNIYEDNQDYKSALKYQKIKSAIRTKRVNEQSKRNFDRLVQALEINYSEEEKRRNEEKIKRERIYTVSLVILLLLSLSFSIPLTRIIKKKRILNDSLLEKTKNLDAKNEELRVSNQLNKKLFSVLAHDLRSPVSSLSGLLEMLEKGYLNESDKQEVFKKLKTQFVNTEQLLGSIVTWSKSQLNRGSLKIENVDLQSIIDKEVELLTQNAINKNVNIKLANSCLGAVKTDKDMVGVIIRNLLSNALKFTLSNGEVEIGCESLENNSFKLWVKDNGIGMTEEKVDQLFSAQSKSVLGTGREQGFGLGLILCYDFAQMLNAEIKVESQEGLGSTFTIIFPAL